MDKQQIFLSYARKQFYFAESLMLCLEAHTIPVWFDTQQLLPGVDWEKSIKQALSECASLVLIASRAALTSEYVAYEVATARSQHKPIYVVLFEAVELPAELARDAVAILDMRTQFEVQAKKLAELLCQPQHYRDKQPTSIALRLPNPRFYRQGQPATIQVHLPTRLPFRVTLIMVVLALIACTGVFFDVLNIQVLRAIIVPNTSSDLPNTDPLTLYNTHLFGLILHGLSNEVYLFISIAIAVLFVTLLATYLFIALLCRHKFVFSLLPVVLLASAILFLNAIFIQDATNHIVAGVIPGITFNMYFSQASLYYNLPNALERLHDMVFAQYSPYAIINAYDYSKLDSSQAIASSINSSYLSVGDSRLYFATVAASMRLPTLLLLALSLSVFGLTRRSGSLLRWLATGVAPDRLRLVSNARWLTSKQQTLEEAAELSAKRVTSWHLLYHPDDRPLACEIEAALANQPYLCKGSAEHADINIVLITNRTKRAWLEKLGETVPNLICVLCTSIRLSEVLPESLKSLRKHQWFDYREHSHEKLQFLVRSLAQRDAKQVEYIFPVIPENEERSIVPLPVWYKSLAMRLFAVWMIALVLFGGGRAINDDIGLEQIHPIAQLLAKLLYYLCIPASLYLFWLATRLVASNITYQRFRQHLNVVMVALWIVQIQFLGYFKDQFSLSMLGAVINCLFAIAWFVPDSRKMQPWLPEQEEASTKRDKTLAVPIWQQVRFSVLIYVCLLIIFYFLGACFFADVAP